MAEDGERAIAIMDRVDADGEGRAPAMMLLDINVPRLTGNQVLERIRRSPRCADVPVVMISSSDSPDKRRRAFERRQRVLPQAVHPGRIHAVRKAGAPTA